MKRFSAKQIAAQAGVGLATVDRVLNDRGNVHRLTVQKVTKAIEELESQYQLSLMRGRTFYFDLLMDTPSRFSQQVKDAFLWVLPQMSPYKIRVRFRFFERISAFDMVEEVMKTTARQCHGLVLKAPNLPEVSRAVNAVSEQLPIVTLVTDIPDSKRLAYIGMNNHSAGQTAAYLLAQWLPVSESRILCPLSDHTFHGEEERLAGFLSVLARYPYLSVIDASGGKGLPLDTERRIKDCIESDNAVSGVYSIGGGNRAILRAFEALGRENPVFIAHDMDDENRDLLNQFKIHAVIDHKLRDDARAALQFLLNHYRRTPLINGYQSSINVVTPFSQSLR
ncbi:hypothetical protein A8L45_05960 [Veronia pacifica]|uniref:Autoinducer 2-binding periplasmic protein LuxP n=1 Tax=Veronia pacifica TaxID=1080227 RepID=A0A1C3EMX4_9GAMM|nr:hypothetical protein A8L45_05960 [Veronia pacifica]